MKKIILILIIVLGFFATAQTIDGNRGITEGYTLLGGTATPNNNSFGNSIEVRRIYSKVSGVNFYLFLECKLNTTTSDVIALWLDFDNYNGLTAGNSAGGQGLFDYNPNFKLDTEADFCLAINPGSGSNCYFDIYRYFTSGLVQLDQKVYLGNCGITGISLTGPSTDSQWGDATTVLHANSIEFAFDNLDNDNYGFEVLIPLSELPGISSSSTLNNVFAAIVASDGLFSNETLPEDVSLTNDLGYNPDFTTVSTFNFFIAPSFPLPVELSSFTYQIENNNVQLNWVTQTEVNNYGFEIERAAPLNPPKGGNNNDEWEKIGFVEGHGNSNSPKYYSFTDNAVTYGTYRYRLKQIDNDGSYEYTEAIELTIGTIPEKFVLEQNYPNPFNPSTIINFSIPVASTLQLEVYNMLGEKVGTLFSGTLEPGRYSYNFIAKGFPSGVYFYKLSADKFISFRKMLLIR